MPTIIRIGPYRFHFYSDEGCEPPHIHVAAPDGECKFWLSPVRLAGNRDLKQNELQKIEKLVIKHQSLLIEKFHEFFGY